MIIIRRGSEERARVETLDEAFVWLLNHQGSSVDFAIRYGGWSAIDESDPTQKLYSYSLRAEQELRREKEAERNRSRRK